jgi:hypothetical protein
MAAFQIRALELDFAELVCMDIWVPVLKKLFEILMNKITFDDKYQLPFTHTNIISGIRLEK